MTATKSINLPNCATAWVLSGFTDEAGDSADAQIAAAKRGFKHIDLRSVEGHNISVLPTDVAEAVKKKLDATGIKVAMFGSPIGKIDLPQDVQIDLDKLKHLGTLSSIFECKAVRIFSYYNDKMVAPMDKWQAETLRRLRLLRDLAADLGLVIYHENESGIFGDTSEHNRIIARELRGNEKAGQATGPFRMIYDFDNYNRTDQDPWQIWLEQRDHVDAFHLKDSDATGQHTPVGEGKGQVRRILADALSRGWHGPLSLEPHLRHSKAVLATHVSGKENQTFAQMSGEDVWQAAAEAAKRILGEIKAPVV